MSRFGLSYRPWLLAGVCVVVAFVAGTRLTNCLAQVPVEPDLEASFTLVVYEDEAEVGRVYRDVAGDRYTEHWVLYPNYTFDRIREAGGSIHIVAEKGGYASLKDFLAHVPFPRGSRYVIAQCQEFTDRTRR